MFTLFEYLEVLLMQSRRLLRVDERSEEPYIGRADVLFLLKKNISYHIAAQI